MKIVIIGAGIIGVSTAWHLLELGHDVTVVERQSDAALETSFANAGQISVSYCEPWANRQAPLKALKWMLSKEAPLLFRPQADWRQWRWGLQFLSQCNDAAFAHNVQQLVALGAYSHAAFKALVQATDIQFQRLEKGIAHYYTDAAAFEEAGKAAALMGKFGVVRKVVSSDELLRIEPAYRHFAHRIVGGTFTASDESGDARVFTQALAQRCVAKGAQFLYQHEVVQLEKTGHQITAVGVRQRPHPEVHGTFGAHTRLSGDAFVVACGSFSAPLLRTVGVDLPIYPGKGYSATLQIKRAEDAPLVSCIDDEKKIAISRLGDHIRVAGTIEVGGYDLTLTSALAQARCRMLSERIETVLPGVCDTRSEAQGGNPNYWAGLRPATPTNIPFIGPTKVGQLWVNAGHGTLGWTHGAGSGKALALLISGQKPELNMRLSGQT